MTRAGEIDFDSAVRCARACYFAGGAGELPPSEMLRAVVAVVMDGLREQGWRPPMRGGDAATWWWDWETGEILTNENGVRP